MANPASPARPRFSLPAALILCLMALTALTAAASRPAGVRVAGLVRDSVSHEPVPFAAIYLKGADVGGLTNEQGAFELYTMKPFTEIAVSAIGFTPRTFPAEKAGVLTIIELSPEGVALGEVEVKAGKRKYSKRDNPAVAFMQRLRRAGPLTSPLNHPYYGYSKYERIRLGLNDFSPEHYSALVKRFPFLEEYADTSLITGSRFLTLSTREKVSAVHHRASPDTRREVVDGLRSAGVDEVADAESMRRFYEDVMREVDLFQNDVPLAQNRFVSPLSRIAPDFYKFYLTDTLALGADTCVVLSFIPRNDRMYGFAGRAYVVKDDSTMFVRQVDMEVPPSVNLNYINKITIHQEYERAPDGTRLKTVDRLALTARVLPGTPEVYADRQTTLTGHTFTAPADSSAIFTSLAQEQLHPEATSRDADYFTRARAGHERGGGSASLMERLRRNKLYYWGEQLLRVIVNGYIPTARKSPVDIGPVSTFLSFNALQGTRLKLGGMTTAHLSPHIFLKGYAAYGTRDHRWAYGASMEYSFKRKKYHAYEFPVHSLSFSITDDINRLGRDFLFTNADNIFLSFHRHPEHMLCYHRTMRLRYMLELDNHFSLTAALQNERQRQSRFIPFILGDGSHVPYYDETSFTLALRYAPGETFYQGRSHRYPINLDAPVLTLSHTYAPAHFLRSRYTLQRTEASVMKRFWFSSWGYLDALLKGGHIWSATPFPQLMIPIANTTYVIQPETFALMNAMEFATDSYASWDLTYWANGAIFNYIPLINRLRLRETFSFRGVWGHLSRRNRPDLNPELPRFPQEAHTRLMTATPYMEVGVGIDNIFSVLRVDYVWRLTYRDTPHASNSGLQLALHFTF